MVVFLTSLVIFYYQSNSDHRAPVIGAIVGASTLSAFLLWALSFVVPVVRFWTFYLAHSIGVLLIMVAAYWVYFPSQSVVQVFSLVIEHHYARYIRLSLPLSLILSFAGADNRRKRARN